MSDLAVGIDLGATNVKVVRVRVTGEVIARETFATQDGPDAPWAKGIRARLEGVTDAVGICAPGLAAPDRRSIAWMQGRLAAIEGLDWTNYLGRQDRVPVLNDAHAALLGETWNGGAAAGLRNVLMLTLGTGVGGAILADGELLRGHLGRAGHVGHITVDAGGEPDLVKTPGSLEDAIGECTVGRRTAGRFATTRDLVAAHRSGDADATQVWHRSIRDLAAGVASLINVVDPEAIVIGGGIAAAGEALFDPLRRELDRMEWRPTGDAVPLVPAALGEWAGAIGVARAALQG